MSREDDFHHLLSRASEAGVRCLSPDELTAPEGAARGLGFALFRVDLSGCEDKADILGRVADALDFPDWFGHNLDALADCLGDMGWRPAPGYLTVFAHADAIGDDAMSALAQVLEVFDCAAGDWADAGVAFWTFVASGDDMLGWPRT